MRRFVALVLFALAALAPVVSSAITLSPTVRYVLANCAANGSTTVNIPAKVGGVQPTFLVTVTDEDAWLCYASTCAADGVPLVKGTQILLTVWDTDVSCRSAGATADVTFTVAGGN